MRMEVIVRSPAYRDLYVHRRDSMSASSLPHAEIEALELVGLVI